MRPSTASLWFRSCVVLGLTTLTACTVGPDYTPPAPAAASGWRQELTGRLAGGQPQLERWWEAFGDPALARIVTQVALDNRSLHAALARVTAARALRAEVGALLYPQLGASGRLEWLRNSGNGLFASRGGSTSDEDLARVTGDVAWELDVFGRVRRLGEAANAELEATVEDYHDLLVILRAEAAQAYVDFRSLQERLVIARANADLQGRTLELARGRFETGLAPELDVAQAQQNLAATEAAIPSLEQALRATENRLSVLLGRPPAGLDDLAPGPSAVPVPPSRFAVGLPAELLRQRPDLRAAERRLAAEVARIGVATAELYPSFSLAGFFGFESTTLGDLVTAGSRAYSIAPGFRWRLFEFGRIRSAIAAREATAAAALADYEQAVLRAFAEVEDALTGLVQEERRRQSLDQALAASRRAVELVRGLYLDGLTDFQNVLDAERTLRAVEDQQAVSRAELARFAILLYRVLGGGVPPARDSSEIQP